LISFLLIVLFWHKSNFAATKCYTNTPGGLRCGGSVFYFLAIDCFRFAPRKNKNVIRTLGVRHCRRVFTGPSLALVGAFVSSTFNSKEHSGSSVSRRAITFFKRGPADPSQQCKRASNSIQDPPPRWILMIFKLKFG
jgi:hypothetical protein